MTARLPESAEAIIIAYLSGADAPRETLLKAVAQVLRDNPGWLEMKWAQVEAAFRISPCQLFLEFLDEYLAAGETAAMAFPDAELHLQDCEGCRTVLAHSLAFAYLDASDAFAALQAGIRAADRAVLVLEPAGWSVWDDLKRIGRWVADREQRLREWVAPAQPAPAMGFSVVHSEGLKLRLALPAEAGEPVSLDILPPETGDSRGPWTWIFRGMPVPDATMTVQIFRDDGGEEREVTGKRNLESGVPVEFDLALPSAPSLYHAVFGWRHAAGGSDRHSATIPVCREGS